MATLNATATAMTHVHTAGMATTGTGAAATAGHKVEPKLPSAHDPRFMDKTVGNAAQAKTMGKYVQEGGAGYGGKNGEDVNNQKDKNEIIDKTDANHLPQYGVLPGQNYVEAIQSYTGLSAVKDLAGMQGFPITEQDWTAIVALQDQGGSPVLATVNYLTGLTNERPADLPASIAAKRDAVSGFQVPGAGKSVSQIVIDPKDVSGNNIARSHHSADWFGTYRKVVDTGIPADWAYALALSDDGTSGSGRFNGFNNQDGNSTGANDGENAYFKMVALASQQLGRPDLFNTLVAGGHAHTALDPSVMTEPKINKLIGWNPAGDQTMSPERVEAIRQYYLRADVDVNQGDFNRHLKTLPQGLRSQLDFTGVQFEVNENTGNNDGGGNENNETQAPVDATGAGTGAITAGENAVGGGDIAPVGLQGSPTISTRPTLENLGVGGPFPVIDPATQRLNKKLQDQLMTAYIETMYKMNDNPWLATDEERAKFEDGAKKGAELLKDATAVDPTKVGALKTELATALADGSISDAERASLSEKLAAAGMTEVAKAVEDGTATDKEIAGLQEQVDGAASAKLEKDITSAMEDGKLTAEERKGIESRLGKDGLDALEAGIKDGTVTKDELTAIAKGTETDETARQEALKAGDKPGEPKLGPDGMPIEAKLGPDGKPIEAKPGEAGATDATAGADKVAKGETAEPTKPASGKDGATDGAKGDKPASGTKDSEDKPGGKPAGDKPAGDKPAGDKPAGDKPTGDKKPEPAAA
ncbi:MAG: hypothetical protein JWL76_583 [Thermoleophilia bacterium]|nr:hypothetical protein [Thermoleophilia bacterium]